MQGVQPASRKLIVTDVLQCPPKSRSTAEGLNDVVAQRCPAWAAKTANTRLLYRERLLSTETLEVGCGADGPMIRTLIRSFGTPPLLESDVLPDQAALGNPRLPVVRRATQTESNTTGHPFLYESFDVVLVFDSLLRLPPARNELITMFGSSCIGCDLAVACWSTSQLSSGERAW